MRIVAWLIRIVLFLGALGFALSNQTNTELRFFGTDIIWRAPLVLFLLIFFGGGAVMGLLAVVPTLYRQRREIGRLRKEVRLHARNPPSVPAPAEVIVTPASSGQAAPPTRLPI